MDLLRMFTKNQKTKEQPKEISFEEMENTETFETLTTPEPIMNSPFHTIKTKVGHMIILGQSVVSKKTFASHLQASNYINHHIDYDLLFASISLYVKKLIESEYKQSKN